MAAPIDTQLVSAIFPRNAAPHVANALEKKAWRTRQAFESCNRQRTQRARDAPFCQRLTGC